MPLPIPDTIRSFRDFYTFEQHVRSARKNRPLLKVNCSAIFDTVLQLIASQKSRVRENEKAKKIEMLRVGDGAESTMESARMAPPASVVPKRSESDDDLENGKASQ